MPKTTIKVEYTEDDLRRLLCQENGIDFGSSKMIVIKDVGDHREGIYISVIIEGQTK